MVLSNCSATVFNWFRLVIGVLLLILHPFHSLKIVFLFMIFEFFYFCSFSFHFCFLKCQKVDRVAAPTTYQKQNYHPIQRLCKKYYHSCAYASLHLWSTSNISIFHLPKIHFIFKYNFPCLFTCLCWTHLQTSNVLSHAFWFFSSPMPLYPIFFRWHHLIHLNIKKQFE